MPHHGRRRSRTTIAGITALTALAVLVPWAPRARAGDDTPDDSSPLEHIDPALAATVEAAPSDASRVAVEVVTSDTTAARAQVRALAGTITGSIPGEVLQVSIAAGQVEALAAAPAVQTVRQPLIANRPVTQQIEFGPVTGQNVGVINAEAWHTAGITGAGVKVGIVDFFDLSLWNPAEHGPLPDPSHRMCLDTSGSAFCPITNGPRRRSTASPSPRSSATWHPTSNCSSPRSAPRATCGSRSTGSPTTESRSSPARWAPPTTGRATAPARWRRSSITPPLGASPGSTRPATTLRARTAGSATASTETDTWTSAPGPDGRHRAATRAPHEHCGRRPPASGSTACAGPTGPWHRRR